MIAVVYSLIWCYWWSYHLIIKLQNTQTLHLKCLHYIKITSRNSHSCVKSNSNVFTILTVRHVACSLLYCSEPENPKEGVIRKQILVRTNVDNLYECSTLQEDKGCCQCLFFTFTDGQQNGENLAGLQKSPEGRYLLKTCCQGEVKKSRVKLREQTEMCFLYKLFIVWYHQSLETLYSQLTSRGDGVADITSSKEDVENELLRILSCQAESVSCGTWCSTPSMWIFVLVIFGNWRSAILTDLQCAVWDS